MRAFIVAFLLAVCGSAHAGLGIGVTPYPGPGVQGNSGSTPTQILAAANESTSSPTATNLDQVNAKGQSFTVSQTVTLDSIQISGTSGTTQNVTIRVGTDANLGAYLEEATASLNPNTTWQTVSFAGTTTLSAGTTYYFGAVRNTTGNWYISRNSADVYAGGVYHLAASGWSMVLTSGYDLQFKIYGTTL